MQFATGVAPPVQVILDDDLVGSWINIPLKCSLIDPISVALVTCMRWIRDTADLLCLMRYSPGLVSIVQVILDDDLVGSWINIQSSCSLIDTVPLDLATCYSA